MAKLSQNYTSNLMRENITAYVQALMPKKKKKQKTKVESLLPAYTDSMATMGKEATLGVFSLEGAGNQHTKTKTSSLEGPANTNIVSNTEKQHTAEYNEEVEDMTDQIQINTNKLLGNKGLFDNIAFGELNDNLTLEGFGDGLFYENDVDPHVKNTHGSVAFMNDHSNFDKVESHSKVNGSTINYKNAGAFLKRVMMAYSTKDIMELINAGVSLQEVMDAYDQDLNSDLPSRQSLAEHGVKSLHSIDHTVYGYVHIPNDNPNDHISALTAWAGAGERKSVPIAFGGDTNLGVTLGKNSDDAVSEHEIKESGWTMVVDTRQVSNDTFSSTHPDANAKGAHTGTIIEDTHSGSFESLGGGPLGVKKGTDFVNMSDHDASMLLVKGEHGKKTLPLTPTNNRRDLLNNTAKKKVK